MNQWRKENRKKLAKEKEIREKYEWKWEWKLEKRERTKQGWKVKINSDIKVNFSSKIGFWWKITFVEFQIRKPNFSPRYSQHICQWIFCNKGPLQ